MAIVTPKIIARRVIRLTSRGNRTRDSQLHINDVIPLVVDVANKLLKAEIYNTRNNEFTKAPAAHYVQTFRRVPVKELTASGLNFIDLPSKYASLPYNEGVQSIRPNTDDEYKNRAMIPVMSGDLDVLGSIVGSMQKQWVYEVEGQKAFFKKICDQTLCEAKIFYVDVKLVVIIGDIGPNEPLNAPPEMHQDIISEVLATIANTFGIKQKKDTINDNDPDTLE